MVVCASCLFAACVVHLTSLLPSDVLHFRPVFTSGWLAFPLAVAAVLLASRMSVPCEAVCFFCVNVLPACILNGPVLHGFPVWTGAQRLLQVSRITHRVPLVVTYHPKLPNLTKIFRNHLPTLRVFEKMKKVVRNASLVPYRWLRSLKDLLVRVSIQLPGKYHIWREPPVWKTTL